MRRVVRDDARQPLRSITHPLRADAPAGCHVDSLAEAKSGFEIAQLILVDIHDDLAVEVAPVKAMLAFYIGGMGPRKQTLE